MAGIAPKIVDLAHQSLLRRFQISLLTGRNFILRRKRIMIVFRLETAFKETSMQRFTPGLFDRLDADDEAAQRASRRPAGNIDAWKESITRDLEALLNTRSALLPDALADYPAVGGSVVNYGLIDFAGMCMTSDTDQKRICTAVRMAIERHEPRLHKVTATLQPRKGAINRVDFVITAELKNAPVAEPMHFNAVFQPSLQRYSIQHVRTAP